MATPSRHRSIEQDLGILFRVSVSSTLVVMTVGFALILFFYSHRRFSQELTSVSQVVAATSRAALAFNDSEAGERVLSGLSATESVRYAALHLPRGAILAEFGDRSSRPLNPALGGTEKRDWSLAAVTLSVPIFLDGEQVGSLVVVNSLSLLYQQISLLLLLSVLLVIVAALGASYLTSTLRRTVSGPIILLRDMTRTISMTKDFSTRLDVANSNENEIQELIKSFNHMLDQIAVRDRELLTAKDKAEQADRMKSVFLATVSHELRTPIHAILGMTDEVLHTSVNEEQRELLEIVKNSGSLLISIVNDILDFSKIEAGKLTLVPTRTELKPLLDRVFQMFETTANKKSLVLRSNIEVDVPHYVIADSGRLVQILVNLIGNALKFTPSGTVDLHVRVRKNSARPGYRQLEFRVTDTGIGIPEDALPYVFDSFSQVRQARASSEGTGLGLSISSRLVGLMGGWIWAESKLGEGSTFSFVVEVAVDDSIGAYTPGMVGPQASSAHNEEPIHEKAASSVAAIAQEAKQVILVVEDNKVNSTLAERVLSRAGYEVLTAENGEECLTVLSKEKIDLVLMDLSMPVMDGLTATKRIREQERERGGHLPIVALTANALDDQAKTCFDAGMDGYLTKPLSRDLLLDTIKECLAINPDDQKISGES